MEPPDFRDNIATFEVVFPNHTLLDQETLTWMAGLGVEGVNGPQMIALALARRGQQLTNKSFRTATWVDDSREAGRLMRELVDRGAPTMQGTRGSATYVLTNQHRQIPVPEAVVGRPEAQSQRQTSRSDPDQEILAILKHGPRTRHDLEVETGLPRRLRALGLAELVGKERSRYALWRATGG